MFSRVMEELRGDRIDAVTTEALIRAFNDDGLADLRAVAERILERVKYDREMERTQPVLTDFNLFAAPTSPEAASRIVHQVPTVPFVLDGVQYDPEDIRRFDGEALLFLPITAPDGSMSLQLLRDKARLIIGGYLQMRETVRLVGLADFPIPGVPPQTPDVPPGSQPPPPPPIFGCGGTTGIPCGYPKPSDPPTPSASPTPSPEPVAPVTIGQVQMFDGGDYTGNWFWLGAGHEWLDLSQVSHGGFLGGDWSQEIFSLGSTDGYCVYCDQVGLTGSALLVQPFHPMRNLAAVGWSDRINSVFNAGANP